MVEAAYGNTVEAERQLDMVITETRRLGFSGYELEARLQRGFVELNPLKGDRYGKMRLQGETD